MLTFTNEPPPDPRGNSLDLRRTPTGRPIRGIITCDNVVGTPTHFFHGRTVPCTGDDCEAHAHGVPWRWHGYVSLFGPSTHSHILFEMTAKAVEPLKAYRTAHGTLRGCLLQARRINSFPNARVIITTGVADLQSISLPNEPHLLEALSIIWNIPLEEITMQGTCKDLPAVNVSRIAALQRSDPPSSVSAPANSNGDE